MNSYEIITNGLKDELSDSEIIDELQLEFPTSRIENNIFILEETKLILETPPKPIPTEMKSNHFLVKCGKEYIDISNGRKFKLFTDKPYAKCKEGLCKEYGKLILKKMIDDGFNPLVFIEK